MKSIEILYNKCIELQKHFKSYVGITTHLHEKNRVHNISFVDNPMPRHLFPSTVTIWPFEINKEVMILEGSPIELIICADLIIEHLNGANFLNTDVWVETYSKLQNKYAQLRDENAASTSRSTEVAE